MTDAASSSPSHQSANTFPRASTFFRVSLSLNGRWKHDLIVSGGDFTDNPWADDTTVRWSDGS
ncbi:hypothetical protein AB0N81_06680 [Streptomyces sp. NPDC093510]|uniref:hypothetical protein n=1 Tax=Streptomyces sp. NPDC093510 TaxID=3155199 RepID=UPI00342C7035